LLTFIVNNYFCSVKLYQTIKLILEVINNLLTENFILKLLYNINQTHLNSQD